MPAEQHGQPYKLGPGRWGLRWYDAAGVRRRKSGFRSRSEALAWFRDVERPRLLGLPETPPDRTLSAFVEEYLEAHAVGLEPSTIRTLRERLTYATRRSATSTCATSNGGPPRSQPGRAPCRPGRATTS